MGASSVHPRVGESSWPWVALPRSSDLPSQQVLVHEDQKWGGHLAHILRPTYLVGTRSLNFWTEGQVEPHLHDPGPQAHSHSVYWVH